MCVRIVILGTIMSVLLVSTVSTRHRTKCTRPGGCQKFLRNAAKGLILQSKQDQRHHKPQASRSSFQHNRYSSRTTNNIDSGGRQSNIEIKRAAVDNLAKDIIVALILKEEAIGIHLEVYRDSIRKAVSRFDNFSKVWATTPPNTEEFQGNVSDILDDLKIGSLAITYDLVRIKAIDTVPTEPTPNEFRLYHNFKHIDDAKIAKNLQDGFKNGVYEILELAGQKVLVGKFGENVTNCDEQNSSHSNKSECKTRSAETSWWEPINSVSYHLQYADLWMDFLEELTSKLETIESQIEPRRIDYTGEFSRWEGGKNITTENLMEALDRLSKEYNLYSIKNNLAIVAATANGFRLNCLNVIIRISLKTTPKCSVKNSTAFIVAPYLLMSQINNCTYALSMVNTSINYIVAVGSAGLYFDTDFVAKSVLSAKLQHGIGFYFTAVSPEFRVAGGNIDLSGRNGPEYTKFNYYLDGEPGMAGEEGGRFFAYTDTVIGSNLKIFLNGGAGGKGQDGNVNFGLPIMACFDPYSDEETNRRKLFCCQGSKTTFWYYQGINGGQAGIGGPGGQYATYVFSNGSQNKISYEQNNGNNGSVGIGWHDYIVHSIGYWPGSIGNNGIFLYKSYTWCTASSNKSTYRKLPLTSEQNSELKGKDGGSAIKPVPPLKIPFDTKLSVRGLVKYKAWATRNSHLFNARRIYDFISTLDLNETIRNLSTTTDLIDEFINSAKTPLSGNLERELLKLSYKSISARALASLQNFTGENREDNVRVLMFVSNAAKARYLSISHPFESILVVNILEFLRTEKSKIVNLKMTVEENLQYEHISQTVSNYNEMIQRHFTEAAFFINSTINPEFDEIEMRLDRLQDALLTTIKELKKDAESNKQKLEEQRNQLKNHRNLNLVANVLKTVGDAVGALYPIGGAFSAGVDLVNTLANPSPDKPTLKPVQIPEAVASGNKYSALRFRKSTNVSLRALKNQLKAVKLKLNEYPEAFPNGLQAIEGHMGMGDGGDPSTPIDDFPPIDCAMSYKKLLTTEMGIKEILRNVSMAIKIDVSKAQEDSLARLTEKQKDLVNNVSKVAEGFLKGVTRGFKDWNKDSDDIEEVSKAIDETEKNIGALQDHINRIEEQMIPEMSDLFDSLSETREDLASQSSIALIVIKHRIQSAVRDIQTDFKKQFVEGTGLEAYFERGLQSLEDAMVTLINIYERLDAYKEQGKMANFTAEVALKPGQYLEKLKDEALQKKFDELRYLLQGDVLIKRQSLVEGAYRMWKFPMVDPVLCEYKNLSSTSLNFSSNANVYKFVTAIESRVDYLIEYVSLAKTTIGPDDKYVIKNDFKHTEKSGAFYVWKNSSTGEFITQMFGGRPIFLHAKPSSGTRLCDAIKFNKVSLFFGSVTNDTALDEEFKQALDDYAVVMTHGGNSFYSFANETFAIPGEKAELYFSFETNAQGEPKMYNKVYEKLLSGDLTLSPYATWSIELQPLIDDIGFTKLEAYSGKFDMYLEGSGSCILKKYAIEGNYASPTCEGY